MAILFRNGKVIIGTGEVNEKGTVAINAHLITYVGITKKFNLQKEIRYSIYPEKPSSLV